MGIECLCLKMLPTRLPQSSLFLVTLGLAPARQGRGRGLEPWPSGVATAVGRKLLRRGGGRFGIWSGGSCLVAFHLDT